MSSMGRSFQGEVKCKGNLTETCLQKSLEKKNEFYPHQSDHQTSILVPQRKKLIDDDRIEHIITDAVQSRNRHSSISSTSRHSSEIDQVLQDESNDWFFEKLLAKFENIRSGRNHRYTRSSSFSTHDRLYPCVERIVERRYYVKKPKSTAKINQLTSTTDLNCYEKRLRQFSAISSITAASDPCSQCNSSKPTHVEEFREQSESLRREILELKTEIQHLHSTQGYFLEQLRAVSNNEAQARAITMNTSIKIPEPLEKKPESKTSESSLLNESEKSSSSTSTSISSKKSSSRKNSSSSNPKTPPMTITTTSNIAPDKRTPIKEFVASKRSSIVSAASRSENQELITTSAKVPTPPITSGIVTKNESLTSTSQLSLRETLKTSSALTNPSVKSLPPTGSTSSRTSSLVQIPSINLAMPNDIRKASIISDPSTIIVVSPTKPLAQPLAMTSSSSSTSSTIHEIESENRPILSPRSQIVASAADYEDSSNSSSGTVTPVPVETTKIEVQSRPPVNFNALGENDMKNLVQYSSQLEVSGFAPLTNPTIVDPNRSSTFWDSVDSYIESTRLANTSYTIQSSSFTQLNNRFGTDRYPTKQLDKYNLEIKPRMIVTSTAPLLLPPLDI